jgi:cytochrome P450
MEILVALTRFGFIAIAYLIALAIYNLFFHPLAKTPGPLWARVSALPSFYHACKGDRHVWIWQNFQVYGDTFRAAPNLILFNNARAYTDIYGTRANISRSDFYSAWQRHPKDIHVMNQTPLEPHARERKLLNLAFTEQSLKASSPLIVKHVDRWVDLLCQSPDPEGWSTPRNMTEWVDFLTFDIIGDLCFGEAFNTKEPGENSLKKIPHLTMETMGLGYKVFPVVQLASC